MMPATYTNSKVGGPLLATAALLIAAALGFAISFLPWALVLGFVGMIFALVAFALWPQVAIVLLLVIATGTIPFIRLDTRSPLELAILAATVICLVKASFDKGHPLAGMRPYVFPLLALAFAWLVALYKGYLAARYPFALADARRYVGWLAFLPLFYYDHVRPGALLKGVIAVSIWAALLLAVQLLSGIDVLRSTSSLELSSQFGEIKRGNIAGGSYLLAFTTLYALVRMASARSISDSPVWLLVFLLSVVGHIAVFSRGVWAGLLLGAAFMLFALPRYARTRVITPMLLAVVALIGAGAAVHPFAPNQVEAVIDRATGFQDEGKKGTSLGARFDENEQALEVIPKHILTGLGHGGEYKRFAKQVERGFMNEATFIHNAYLWVALKFGLLGVVPLLWIVIIQFKRSWVHCRSTGPNALAVGAALVGAFITMLVNGLSSPIWAQPSDLLAFAALAALTASRKAS